MTFTLSTSAEAFGFTIDKQHCCRGEHLCPSSNGGPPLAPDRSGAQADGSRDSFRIEFRKFISSTAIGL